MTILTIAGFDPSSGAGITADLAVFSSHGLFGTACITALTVQSTLGVRAVEPVGAPVIRDTLECLWDDLPPAAIKIGMLASEEAVLAVISFLREKRRDGFAGPVVLDPVMRSTSGRELLSPAGVIALKEDLLSLTDWVTPNLAELHVLSGGQARSHAEIEDAAQALRLRYPGLGVVATGGDPSDVTQESSADDLVVLPSGDLVWLTGERIESRATHGTGCAFSSAMACGLLLGLDGVAAARAAKDFVAEAIRRAGSLGRGKGPMNLLWRLRDKSLGPSGSVP